MKRSPLCGRNFEYFSEDPFLAGELAVGIVDGIQAHGVGTSLKHYAANNQETDRLRVDAQVDERTLREIYLPAFERVVTASQPWTVMCSYNKVNGLSASREPVAAADRAARRVRASRASSCPTGARSTTASRRWPAGTDLEMPPALGRSPEQVVAAVALRRAADRGGPRHPRPHACSSSSPRACARARPRRVLRRRRPPRARPGGRGRSRSCCSRTTACCRWPPTPRIAVIGELARTPRFQGAGSSQVNPTRVDVAPRRAARRRTARSPFAAGYGLGKTPPATRRCAPRPSRSPRSAEHASSWSSGCPAADESEGFDRTHMDLPANQRALLAAVAEVNPRRRRRAGQRLDRAARRGRPARPGARRGLAGRPGGGRRDRRRPHRRGEPLRQARRDGPAPARGQLVLPGLPGRLARWCATARGCSSATAATTRRTSTSPSRSATGCRTRASRSPTSPVGVARLAPPTAPSRPTVTVTVTNTGDRAGAEVVQVYVRDVESSVARPVRELKGFAKVAPRGGGVAGGRRSPSTSGPSRSCRTLHGRWAVEAGRVRRRGRHQLARPAAGRALTVDAPRLAPPLTRDSTLQEWMADPRGPDAARA